MLFPRYVMSLTTCLEGFLSYDSLFLSLLKLHPTLTTLEYGLKGNLNCDPGLWFQDKLTLIPSEVRVFFAYTMSEEKFTQLHPVQGSR